MKKILFCDIDGVLIVNGTFSQAAVKNLNELLTKEPELKIVISSSWRHNGLQFVKDMFKYQGINEHKIVGVTDPINRDSRGHHIERYLQDHKEIDKFVILDDKNDMDKVLNHLVQTNPYVGLTGSDVNKTLDILKN
jgi:hydroxymethylpyrimidine pyrophosphatase-like HAD family hydrolase